MRYLLFIVLEICVTYFLCSCTFNVSMAHTSGTATDVIDDTASNTPNVSPNISIPGI